MWLRTLRGRLTLWNLGVLTLTLVLFGLVLNYTNQRRLENDIDRDLWNRAHQAATPPPPARGNPFGGPGPGPFGGGPPGPPLEPQPPPNDRFGNLRRPERFDSSGRLLGPNGNPVLGESLPNPQGLPPNLQDQRPYAESRPPVFDEPLLKKALAGQEGIEDTNLDGVPIRVAAVPRRDHGQVIGAVETARELTDFQALWQGQSISLLILLPLAILVGGAGALFLTNRALKPIAAATRTASAITEQDLSKRLPVQGDDELAELSSTFNAMLGRLDTAFAGLKKAYSKMEEAFENQRRFTADASHELRTPLTRLKLATSAGLAEESVPKSVVDSLKIADQSAEAMSKIVQQLLLLSRADAGQLGLLKKPVDLRVVAAEAVDSMPDADRITLKLANEPAQVCGDEDHLKRVVLNLVQNALRHTPEKGAILVEVEGTGRSASIRVADEGEGIAPDHLPHLGERFYRVDQARSRSEGGFGLGLSICKSIVEAHGGSIAFRSALGKGTEVTVALPTV